MSAIFTPPPVRNLRQEAKDTAATLTPEIRKLESAKANALMEWLQDAGKHIDAAIEAVDELERIESNFPAGITGEKLAPYLKQMKDHIHGFTARSWDIFQYRHVFKPLAGVAEDAYYDAKNAEDEAEAAEDLHTTPCPAMSVGGIHSESYFDGGRCIWCGEYKTVKNPEIPATGLNP